MGKKEAPIQKAILEYLAAIKIVAWKHPSVGIYNAKSGGYIPGQSIGVSDIEGYVPAGHKLNIYPVAIPLYIEVKAPGGKLTSNQAYFLEKAGEGGCIAFKASSVDDVDKFFKRLLQVFEQGARRGKS